MMKNLLIETRNILAEHGHSLEDVTFVGCREFAIPIESFRTLADAEYDSGYGAPEVAEDLIVVGPYWWLERHEYDGSEWWEYKEKPQIPNRVKCPKSLFARGVGWETLSMLCEDDGVDDKRAIELVPSAQPERKVGEWFDDGIHLICTSCGEVNGVSIRGINGELFCPPFCQNCGSYNGG